MEGNDSAFIFGQPVPTGSGLTLLLQTAVVNQNHYAALQRATGHLHGQ